MILTKKSVLSAAAIIACGVLFAACASASKNGEPTGFAAVKGRVWQLSQVKDASGKVTFDHSKLNKEFFNDIYTLQFDDQRATGKAAPNRYTGPYTLGEGNAISFKHFASTLMMGIRTPEGLAEHEYYQLFEKVTSWKYSKNQLTFNTVDKNGAKVTMIFKEFDYR
ncbi:heat shock protein HslJ [Elusimicrobium posterum]|uniref:META domain-containing protein n=1 Tax=Elusimicrobium posterum TaxID=3116653 RepID=UPI003C716756